MSVLSRRVLAVLAAWAVVKRTRIGPVVYRVNRGRGWGVHLGDLTVVPLLVWAFLPRPHRLRRGPR